MIQNPYPGKFIIFEGIDGSGKTTQAELLEEKMKREEYPVLRTKEPRDDNPFGGLVRAIYMKDPLVLNEALPQMLGAFLQSKEYKAELASATKSQLKHYKIFEMEAYEIIAQDFGCLPMLIQLGMIFDRFYHLKHEIIPALKQGISVISDRYFISTLAYGAGEHLDWRRLLKDHFDILGEYFIVPDRVFFLDLPLELGLKRTEKKQAGKKEYFDTQATMKKIQNAYYEIFNDKEIKEKQMVIKIDGSPEDPQIIHKEIWKYASLLFKKIAIA